jgi:hypothetical protein
MYFRYDLPQLQSLSAKGAKYLSIPSLSRHFSALPLSFMGLSTHITSSFISNLTSHVERSAVPCHSSLTAPFVPPMGDGVTRSFAVFPFG